jgi:glycosyltransferase involved in cell wall biosynthesis
MPEIIHERKNGFLVDSIDAAVEAVPLAAALDRREVRESVKQRFDAARMVDDYLSVYRRICADNGTSRSPAVP